MTGRIGRTRAGSPLASRLQDTLRRRVGAAKPETLKSISLLGEDVAPLPAESAPVTALLQTVRMHPRAARSTEYLHVSDLIGKCIRKFALVESLGKNNAAQAINLSDALTYAQGDAIHDVLRARIALSAPGQVWGFWKCRCGTTSTAAPCTMTEIPEGKICPACKFPLDVYKEVPFRDEARKVVGNPDLLLLLPNTHALHVTELKSMAHDRWKELVRPEPDHVIQVLFYWDLIRRSGYRVTDKVSIVYATKGWVFNGNASREFVVDAPSQVDRLAPYFAEAEQFRAFQSTGKLPDRTCKTAQDSTAKKCEVCGPCFGVTNEKPVQISISSALSGAAGPTKRTRS